MLLMSVEYSKMRRHRNATRLTNPRIGRLILSPISGCQVRRSITICHLTCYDSTNDLRIIRNTIDMEVEDNGTDIQKAEETPRDKNDQRYMRAALDMVWQLILLAQTSNNYLMRAGGTGISLKRGARWMRFRPQG